MQKWMLAPALPLFALADKEKTEDPTSTDDAWPPSLLIVLSDSGNASAELRTQQVQRRVTRRVTERINQNDKQFNVVRPVTEHEVVTISVPESGTTHILCTDFDLDVVTDEEGTKKYASEIDSFLEVKQGTTVLTANSGSLSESQQTLTNSSLKTPESKMTADEIVLDFDIQNLRILAPSEASPLHLQLTHTPGFLFSEALPGDFGGDVPSPLPQGGGILEATPIPPEAQRASRQVRFPLSGNSLKTELSLDNCHRGQELANSFCPFVPASSRDAPGFLNSSSRKRLKSMS